MKRLVPATIAAVLTVGTFLGVVYAAGSFNQKLSPNQQIIHALNRLTYGPHPGDVEEVRRIGLAKWIELQLHPDQIPENPVLEAKLKPLATLNMSMADVVREYTPRPEEAIAMMTPFGPLNMNSILSLDQVRKVMNGTAEERTEVLKSLPPDKRKEVLAGLPPNVLAYTPEFKDEAAELQKMRRSDASCWGTVFQRKPRHRSLRVLRTGMPAVLSPHRSYWAHRTSKGGSTTMLTRRVFLRGSAIVMAGMGMAPGWLARAAASESKKRKTLVAIFMRGAADGLNIVVPFGEKR